MSGRKPSKPRPTGRGQLRALVGSLRAFTAATSVPAGRLSLAVLEHAGDRWAVIEIASTRSPLLDRLTAAERRVALYAIEGHSNKAIAARCHTSDRTVANQLRCIYEKLGLHSRTELAHALLGALRTEGEPA